MVTKAGLVVEHEVDHEVDLDGSIERALLRTGSGISSRSLQRLWGRLVS